MVREPRNLSLALSEFHFMVLINNMLKVGNRVSQKVVEEQRFNRRSDLGSPIMLGLCSDVAAGAYYAYDENFIFEVGMIMLHSDALQVIATIREELKRVEINVSQCRRLGNRIDGIVEVLKVYKRFLERLEDLAKLHEYLLTLLKRARSLVIECGGSKWVEKILIRANNKEAFEEVHEELTKFLYKCTGFTGTAEEITDFNTATLPPSTNLLNEDAERDLQDMLEKLEKYLRASEENPNSE